MADYTYLNSVPVARIHKCNAQEALDDAERMLDYCRDKVLCLAAASPSLVHDEAGMPMAWTDHVHFEIDSMWDEILEQAHRAFAARYIVENPDDCMDELDPADAARVNNDGGQ